MEWRCAWVQIDGANYVLYIIYTGFLISSGFTSVETVGCNMLPIFKLSGGYFTVSKANLCFTLCSRALKQSDIYKCMSLCVF